jgi:UDP-N-acetyl-2-amino-2-deoxyglucuronate dehydrogenase
MLRKWQAEDRATFASIDATEHYHQLQVTDFLQAVLQNHDPMLNGFEGRKTVELFTAIYRSQRDRKPVTFPLDGEQGSEKYDGRLPGRKQ